MKFVNDHDLGYVYPFSPAADRGLHQVHEGMLNKG